MKMSTRFCGSSLPARSTATSPSASPSSRRFAARLRARIREVRAVVDHLNCVSAYAEAEQFRDLALADRDDRIRQRQDAAQQQRPPRSQRKAVRAMPVGDPLGRPPPGGEHPETVGARRAGHDHVGVRRPQRPQRRNRWLASRGRRSSVAGTPARSSTEKNSPRPSSVARLTSIPRLTQPRQQNRPVALGAPALQVGAQEDRLSSPSELFIEAHRGLGGREPAELAARLLMHGLTQLGRRDPGSSPGLAASACGIAGCDHLRGIDDQGRERSNIGHDRWDAARTRERDDAALAALRVGGHESCASRKS